LLDILGLVPRIYGKWPEQRQPTSRILGTSLRMKDERFETSPDGAHEAVLETAP